MLPSIRTNPRTTFAFTLALGVLTAAMWTARAQAPASAGPEPPASPAAASARTPPQIRFGHIEPPVVAQRDITVRAPKNPHDPTPVAIESSGIAWLGDGRLLMTSDRHQHLLFSCRIDLSTMTITDPEPIQIIRNEQQLLDDAECVAVRPIPGSNAWHAFVLCSLSNNIDATPLPQRRHLLSFRFDPTVAPIQPTRVRVVDAGAIRQQVHEHFQTLGVTLYETWNALAGRNTYRWGNVEGLAFAPRPSPHDNAGAVMIVGLRNPLIHGSAVVAALRLDDPPDSEPFQLLDLMLLDLGAGRGVADLCWDPVTAGYLIVGARSNGPKLDPDQPFPPSSLDSALFWWSGRKGEQPILIARVPDMTIEAVARLGDSPYVAIVSDEGDVSEGRAARQSVLTVLRFTGLEDAP